jgi:hypothetical protein
LQSAGADWRGRRLRTTPGDTGQCDGTQARHPMRGQRWSYDLSESLVRRRVRRRSYVSTRTAWPIIIAEAILVSTPRPGEKYLWQERKLSKPIPRQPWTGRDGKMAKHLVRRPVGVPALDSRRPWVPPRSHCCRLQALRSRHPARVTRVAAPFNDPHVAKKSWNGGKEKLERAHAPNIPPPTCPVGSAPRLMPTASGRETRSRSVRHREVGRRSERVTI